ncbi:Phosphate transport system permease protein PstA [BD1-7 clade bacterium]|uniref:Phosphate transport system permease protein PstA n=1 Tax=BD1-7 clade bacterium TaxID=2029982 RepID=A0A5S9NKA3_9GAMM|nr:Phosphate transport system permease protein PstA [BD1-7 clade bacterium]CAA0093608.1 Phosphate transport system permease protein PstA [BD1-7 clade bacterium]
MNQTKPSLKNWFKGGDPWVWLNAAAVSVSVIAVLGLLAILAVNGFGHFWPSDVRLAKYQLEGMDKPVLVMGEVADSIGVPAQQLIDAGFNVDPNQVTHNRLLLKVGNRDVIGADFAWFLEEGFQDVQYPAEVMVLERREWGNFYGTLEAVKQNGEIIAQVNDDNYEAVWADFQKTLVRADKIHEEIHEIEKSAIGSINHGMERLRLRERGLELNPPSNTALAIEKQEIAAERAELDAQYAVLQKELNQLYQLVGRDAIVAKVADGSEVTIKIANIVRATRPNALTVFGKLETYGSKLWEFLSEEPREANTEGGIYPAIFGTVMMVLLMSIMVTPFGVVAAVYLREYAPQGPITRTIRIAVNNLAGVPSIVYGVFGLGFFIYFIGHHADQAFFPEALPSPTFGTPGLLWASLTLALLTVPVVIVATEEGLARIPRAVREGSLALGATKAETLWRVVLPMASPAMMTGLILAVARAAGEVAPLMLVGVVKLAPSLPLDGNYPYLHLDQKFMHLGFHIYDVGFQSPNVEAARPLVYATALLLVIVIALLNMSAVAIRNHLREKYKSLEH